MAEARAEGESLAIPNGTTESEIAAAKEGTILGAPGDRPDSPEMKEETTNGDVKVEDPEKDAGDHVEAQKESTGAESQSNGIKRTTSPQQSERKNDVKERKTGNLSNLVSQEESSDPVAIRKQVEFYFSDSNLAQDKFLFTQVDGHKNNPVPISTIHSFKRMRHFQPFLAVVDALKESTSLDVIEDGDKPCVKRKLPLPEDMKGKSQHEVQKVIENAAMARSVYVKGFGEEQPSTQFDLEAFFTPYGPTNSVRLRRTMDKSFKGSVFVEFDSVDTTQKFLALDPKPQYNGQDLLIMSKKQYCDGKVADINAGRVRPKSHGDRDWRERRDRDNKTGSRDDRRGGRRGGRGFGSRHGRGQNNHRQEDRSRVKKQNKESSPNASAVPEAPLTEKAYANEDTTEKTAEPAATEPAAVELSATESIAAETTSAEPAAIKTESSLLSKKRLREGEGDGEGEGADEPSVKKVDVKAAGES